jgi:hypothetical protein
MDEISNVNAWGSMSEASINKSNTRYAEAGNKDLLVKTKVIESRLEVLNFLQAVSSENLWRIFIDGVTSRSRERSVAADVEGLARAGEIQQLIVQWLELARPMRDRARAGEAKVQRIRDLKLDRSEPNKVTAAKLLLLEMKYLIEQLENDKEPGLVLLTTGVVSDKLALEFKDVTPLANLLYTTQVNAGADVISLGSHVRQTGRARRPGLHRCKNKETSESNPKHDRGME